MAAALHRCQGGERAQGQGRQVPHHLRPRHQRDRDHRLPAALYLRLARALPAQRIEDFLRARVPGRRDQNPDEAHLEARRFRLLAARQMAPAPECAPDVRLIASELAEGAHEVKTRSLGATGYLVSEIGYGGWGLGGSQWRGVDDAQGRDALRAAVDQGITFFDTALAYGNGHSERLIGRALKDEIRSGRAIVASKIPPRNEEWPGRADRPLAAVFPAK